MKKLTLLFAITLGLLSLSGFSSTKVLFMVSEGFYAPEYYTPLEIFKDAGYKITTAAKYEKKVNPDQRQIGKYPSIRPDITFKKVDPQDYDVIVFAGGNGAWEDFFPNADVHKILTHFMKNNKVTGLLCSSTGLLGVANNLDGSSKPIASGRKVTGYKRVKGLLVKLGKVKYSAGVKGKPHVVVDRNLITGRDPISSELFANKIIEVIRNKK